MNTNPLMWKHAWSNLGGSMKNALHGSKEPKEASVKHDAIVKHQLEKANNLSTHQAFHNLHESTAEAFKHPHLHPHQHYHHDHDAE